MTVEKSDKPLISINKYRISSISSAPVLSFGLNRNAAGVFGTGWQAKIHPAINVRKFAELPNIQSGQMGDNVNQLSFGPPAERAFAGQFICLQMLPSSRRGMGVSPLIGLGPVPPPQGGSPGFGPACSVTQGTVALPMPPFMDQARHADRDRCAGTRNCFSLRNGLASSA